MSRPSRTDRHTTCSLCGGPVDARFRPFCSQGCRDRDLLNWLGDAYRVPVAPAGEELDENAQGGVDREA